MLLDHNGQPISSTDLRRELRASSEPQTASLAHIRTEHEAHPARGLTPARLHNILQAGERGDWLDQLDLADDIEERDGHCFAELDKRAGAVASLEINVTEPPNASAAEKALTERVREWLEGIADFEDVVREMMSGVLRAFSAHELVWQPTTDSTGATVLLPTLTHRPHRWFAVDTAERNTLALRRPNGGTEALQPLSWLIHRHKTRNGYLARAGLVRVLAWPYLYKNFAVRDLAEFLEIYGLPMRLGKYPSGASDTEKRTLLRAVSEIGHNAAGIIPQGMVVDFMEAAKGTEAPFDSMQNRMEAIQSKVILGQTLSSSEGQHGTQALGQVHEGVRMDIRNSDARQVEATLNAQVISRLCLINVPGADPKRLPRLQINTTEPEDLEAFAKNLPPLVNMGLKVGVKWAQDKLQIPEPEDGEDVLQAAAPPAPAAAPGADPADPKANPKADPKSAKPSDKTKPAALKASVPPAGSDAMDALIDEALADWEHMLTPMVSPLLAAMDAAAAAGESLESFRARMPALIQEMDPTPLAERLARAAFVARLAGAADLDMTGG